MAIERVSLFDDNDSRLLYDNRHVLDIMEDFFYTYPRKYKDNYISNLEDVYFYHGDFGDYLPKENVIIFNNSLVLIHELMHMASYDRNTGQDAFNDESLNGIGLTEGMTEYLTMKAISSDYPSAYLLQTFVVTLLDKFYNIERYYFNPNREKFVSLFSRNKEFNNLDLLLDYYTDCNHKVSVNIDDVVILVKNIILNLVSILLYDQDEILVRDKVTSLYNDYSKIYMLFDDDMKCYVDSLFDNNRNKLRRYIK